MLATFPLSLAQFQDKIKISVAEFFPFEPRHIDRTASGAILSASIGSGAWRGSFVLPRRSRLATNVAEVEALLSILDRTGASFLVYNPSRTHPYADPDGSILGAATPQIASLDAGDARAMSLSGLPANYQLTAGDMLGYTYGSSPTRYALHRLVSDVQADGTGATALFEVTPLIQPAVTTGAAVTLIKPVMKAIMEPNPGYGAHRPVATDGARFTFVQTLR